MSVKKNKFQLRKYSRLIYEHYAPFLVKFGRLESKATGAPVANGGGMSFIPGNKLLRK